MNSFTTLIRGARLIVDHCLAVGPGDNVLILADDLHRREAEALSGCAHAVGAFPVIADITPHVASCMASVAVPVEPPRHVAEAMRNSDVIIITTVLEWANRFAHVDPVRESCQRGARIASVEEGMGAWNLTREDIDEIVARTEKLIAAMRGAKWVRVVAPGGTDVRVCVEGRPPLRVVPVKERGAMMGPIPLWGEVAYAAVEDRTEGRIVVDGIMLGVGASGTVKSPIEIEVRAGRAVSIRGGEEADRLRQVVEQAVEAGDAGAAVIGEFAIGTSHKESLGTPSEKGMMGTVHFALGDNWHCYPGGQNKSKLHLDGSVRDVTIEVDGRVIVQDGKLSV